MKKYLLLLLLISSLSFSSLETCFVPPSNCDQILVEHIDRSFRSIDVQAYHLTSKTIINALLVANKRGVSIRIIVDKMGKKESTVFKDSGISVWIDTNRSIAHNKVMIFDDNIIETGSFNYTESAQKRNVENMLFIKNRKTVIEYKNNFLRRMLVSQKIY